jgi:hypothetical protein
VGLGESARADSGRRSTIAVRSVSRAASERQIPKWRKSNKILDGIDNESLAMRALPNCTDTER